MMGMVEKKSKVASGVSSALAEKGTIRDLEEEKNEVKEALGTLTSENGVEFPSVGDKGLFGDAVDREGGRDEKEGKEKEKDDKCDEKIVTVDVPIVETSKNMDVEAEDLEKKHESRDREIATFEVPIVEKCENMDVEVENLEKKNEICDGKIVTVEVPIAEISENMDAEVGDLEKKDEICDGEIVTVAVPIAETSVEMDDLSDEGHGLSYGDFVWGKIKSHPWWPGRVYDPSDASEFALKLKQKHRLLVAYFGDGTFAWCHPSQLKTFEDNFDDMVRQSSSKAFTNAVQEALNEVGRLMSMKMSSSFVATETLSDFAPLLAKNSGIKGGVFVPETGIERLSAVPIEVGKLLSQVKQIAETTDIASLLELEILKSRLSAFYLSRGGYRFVTYEEPQRVFGLEDSRMDEAVDVVEAPTQGPFEENYSILPLSPKSGGQCHSTGSMSNRGRKQKSIAQIMGEDKVADEMVDAIGSIGRKKIKGGEVAMASKPVRKRKELLLSTDRNVLRTKNESCGRDKENSEKETPLQSSKKKGGLGNETIGSGTKTETDEGKSKEQNEGVYSPRERKKSKYLSPPFTTSIRVLLKENIKKEARDNGKFSPASKCNGDAFQELDLSDSLNYQTQDDNKKTFDPETVQVSSGEILSKVREIAVSPQILRDGASLDRFEDFIFVMRSSLFLEGSLYKVGKKSQSGRKRKKLDSDDISPNEDSEPTKRRKEANPSMPKGKRAPETKNEKPSGALLFVSFWPGSSMPSKSDLITIFSKFGALNEEETNMFHTNHTARVSFQKTRDAEKALNDSQNKNPFESAKVTYELKYVSADSQSGGHTERSKSKLLRDKNKRKTPPATPSVPHSQGTDASKLNTIKHKLQGLASMIESSDGKSPDFKTKMESKVKDLIEDVNKMVESTSP